MCLYNSPSSWSCYISQACYYVVNTRAFKGFNEHVNQLVTKVDKFSCAFP